VKAQTEARTEREQMAQIGGRLTTSAEAAAALAGALQLRAGERRAPEEVGRGLEEVLAALGVADLLPKLPGPELAALSSLALSRLRQAVELGGEPAREPGWRFTEPDVLRSQGLASAAFAPVLRRAVAPRLEDLTARLQAPGARFLDVGAGVAALTIAICRLWPTLSAVGIDPWRPALTLGLRGVEAAGLAERIELRQQDVADLADRGAFDLAWVPVSFLSRDVLTRSAGPLRSALRPGGWAIFNMYSGPDPLGLALARLRTARSGGWVTDPAGLESVLAGAGYAEVRTLPAEILPHVALTVGRRPSTGGG
jgi:SAM-dependent methyltransferase